MEQKKIYASPENSEPNGFQSPTGRRGATSQRSIRLWAVLSQGIHMRVLLPAIPCSTERISPSVTAIQSRHEEDPRHEQDLPTNQALLWACCSPHDFGMPKVWPLCEALRAGDDEIVVLLLKHRSVPVQARRWEQRPHLCGHTNELSKECATTFTVFSGPEIERGCPVQRRACGQTQT